jgi:hypothetical protein
MLYFFHFKGEVAEQNLANNPIRFLKKIRIKGADSSYKYYTCTHNMDNVSALWMFVMWYTNLTRRIWPQYIQSINSNCHTELNHTKN